MFAKRTDLEKIRTETLGSAPSDASELRNARTMKNFYGKFPGSDAA
jgi:hypothetical protein